MPKTIDLGRHFGPIINQGLVPKCSASTTAGLLWPHRLHPCVDCLYESTKNSPHPLTVEGCLSTINNGFYHQSCKRCEHSPKAIDTRQNAVTVNWNRLDKHATNKHNFSEIHEDNSLLKILNQGSPFAFQVPLFIDAVCRSANGRLRPPRLRQESFAMHALLCVG